MLAEDTEQSVPTARFALQNLARLAFADPQPLLDRAADARQAVREIAVRALPGLDAGQGLPALLECLGDDRARWAIYAIRKVFSEMSPTRALALLREVPTRKVTVAKEVVRLLGELGTDEAYTELLARVDSEGHRDVRIAALRALWDHLDRDETWRVFEGAVGDPDWVVAAKLADIPLQRLSYDAELRVVGLLERLLARPEADARLDLLRRIGSFPLRDPARRLVDRLAAHVATDDPAESALAIAALLSRIRIDEAERVVSVVRGLGGRWRHLAAALDVLERRVSPFAQTGTWRVALDVQRWLESDPLLTPRAIALGARLHDSKELGALLVRIAAAGRLHHDAIVAAGAAIRLSASPEAVEAQLAGSRDPVLRRLALEALVQAAAPQDGWTAERRARLAQFAADPSPAVAGPASFVFPPDP
jgi:hypothetical protein